METIKLTEFCMLWTALFSTRTPRNCHPQTQKYNRTSRLWKFLKLTMIFHNNQKVCVEQCSLTLSVLYSNRTGNCTVLWKI